MIGPGRVPCLDLPCLFFVQRFDFTLSSVDMSLSLLFLLLIFLPLSFFFLSSFLPCTYFWPIDFLFYATPLPAAIMSCHYSCLFFLLEFYPVPCCCHILITTFLSNVYIHILLLVPLIIIRTVLVTDSLQSRTVNTHTSKIQLLIF